MGFRIAALSLLIIVPNVIIFIIGCTMVGFSADWIIHKADKYEGVGELKDDVRIGSALVMTAGIFACITSVLAICGAAASNRCLLISYSVVMSLILLFEIGGAITGFVAYNYAKNGLKEHLYKSLDNYELPDNFTYNTTWGWNTNDLFRVQYYFDCCGVNGTDDWQKAKKWPQSIYPNNYDYLPASCCHKKRDNEYQSCRITAKSDKKDGCYKKMRKFLPYIGVACIVIFFIQLAMLILAIFLSRRIDKDQKFAIF